MSQSADAPGRDVRARKPRCPVCGFQVRRWRETKRCPTCKRTLPAQSYGHARARNDHLDSQCIECKRNRQRAGYRKDKYMAMGASVVDKSPERVTNDVVTGVVEHVVEMPSGEAKVSLTDAYYDEGEGPERSVYVGWDGTLTFYTAPEGYRVGETVHVLFDDRGSPPTLLVEEVTPTLIEELLTEGVLT